MGSYPRRALISVYDKAGGTERAAGLIGLGWEGLASGGTAAALASSGLPVVDVADHTGSPAMLGHRVVTLHPRIHGGILADRGDPAHRADLQTNKIAPIDLVVVNLYPFEARPGVETIDVGGPTLLRAAAKNHAHVGAVVDPRDYPLVLAELADRGWLTDATRRRLARDAFAHVSAHDAAIIAWLDSPRALQEGGGPELPDSVHLVLRRAEELRYGENPHQSAARYRPWGRVTFFDRAARHGGKELSYLNLADAAAAWRLACELGAGDESRAGGGRVRPAAVIVKHANPCGAAVAETPGEAYTLALDCDRQSAFGGVVAFSAPVAAADAAAVMAGPQIDVVIAPGYSAGVRDRFVRHRRATRVLTVPPRCVPVSEGFGSGYEPPLKAAPPDGQPVECGWGGPELRALAGLNDDFLLQDSSRLEFDPSAWRVVTQRAPTATERADAAFAWRVCSAVSSNAVVLARGGVAWGIGAGQQSRAEAGRLAAAKAAGRALGGACASDGFYPFPDGVDAAADAGAAVVVQPGGSINDAEVIAAADARGLAMLFTGQRRFRH